MRNVILWMGVSLDGFTSAPNDELDWLAPHVGQPEAEKVFDKIRERSDTILVGRINYEGYEKYWPKVKDDPKASHMEAGIARWLDDVTKVVFSRTLREVTWKKARLAKGTVTDEVAALKRAPGKDIVVQNSTRLARSMFEADLIDEIQMMVAPVVLGAGRSLFAGLPRIDLGPAELTPFDDGTFAVRYEVKHRKRDK